jgi:hypothetical protein
VLCVGVYISCNAETGCEALPMHEFTCMDFIQYVEKLEICFRSMTSHGLHGSNSKKGYMYGFHGFVESVRRMGRTPREDSDEESGVDSKCGVDVDYESSQSVSSQIERVLFERINVVTEGIVKLFDAVGVKRREVSPFADHIGSFHQLGDIFYNYMSDAFRAKSRHTYPCESTVSDGHHYDREESKGDDLDSSALGESIEGLLNLVNSMDHGDEVPVTQEVLEA